MMAGDVPASSGPVLFGHLPVPPGPQLHLLAIGISNYNPQHAGSLHLDYAEGDARDFADKIMATQGTLYTVKPNFLSDKTATREGIMQAFQNIRRGMEKGSGNDLAVVFFAGHGAPLKQVICRALADAGIAVAPADLEDGTPRRRTAS